MTASQSTKHPASPARPWVDNPERHRLVARAQDLLRGARFDENEPLRLPKKLKALNEFGYARRLLARAREQRVTDTSLRLELAQQHALCTYKDPDLPRHQKLREALVILEGAEDLRETENQETLGLAGAIYKRMWGVDADKQHLERSLMYYERGHRVGPENDYGYTGINAALVLDLLAHVEERAAEEIGLTSDMAEARRDKAKRIRGELIEVLPELPHRENGEWLEGEWWYHVTLAEAYFGLGRFDSARGRLETASSLPETPVWEFETTATQLATLALLQPEARSTSEGIESTDAWAVLEEFLQGDSDAVRTVFSGKLGLALSGGGLRSSLFHIGVLAKLAELDLLRHVHVLSCVSGGSIVGAHYYLEVRRLLQEKADHEITRGDYVDIVERVERDFVAGVQRNIRTRVAANLWANLKMAFSNTYSRTVRAGELYESELYARVRDGGGKERHINDLKIQPLGESNFRPKERNWLRRNKVPMLVLNATTLNTGHNWQFTTTWMGESPFSIDPEIDGNWRYRRMYYSEAPEAYRNVRLGLAVGASACVPGLFEPVALPNLYPKDELPEMVVRLVDGGIHDNQGVASLLEQDCDVLLVSDASGQMTSEPEPAGGVLGPLLRTNSALMERVRGAQFADLAARRRGSLLKGLAIVHLKKGLEVDPISWKRCREPPDVPLKRVLELLDYRVLRRVQRLLAGIRTDLDSFSQVECWALMASGYLQTEAYVKELEGFHQAAEPRPKWNFLALEPALKGNAPSAEEQDRIEKLLAVGKERAFKVWRLSLPLQVTAIVLGVAALMGFVWLWTTRPEFPVLAVTVDKLGWIAFSLVLGAFGAKLVARIVRYKDTLRKFLTDVGVAVVGFVAARIHLHVFDPWFKRLGRFRK